MEKIFKYFAKVFIPEFIQCSQPMEVIEFNEIDQKIRIACKSMPAIDYSNFNPEKVSEEMENEKSVQVTILLKDLDINDALYHARNILEEKLAILSFMLLFPCRVVEEGFIMELTPDQSDFQCIPEKIKITPIFTSARVDDADLLINKPDEKIINSLRWYRKALIGTNSIDRFISLWIAFEMISSRLKPAERKYLTCPKCRNTIEICPICNKSTDTRPVEKDGIINHIKNNLKINDDTYYEKLNEMRNAIFHGRITDIKPREIKTEIQKIKYCLITAYHYLIYGYVPKETSEFIQKFVSFNQEIDVITPITLSKEGMHDVTDDLKYFEVKITS